MEVRKLGAVMITTLILLLADLTIAANQGILWRGVTVSLSRLLRGSLRYTSNSIPETAYSPRLYNYTCSLSCHQVDWCNLWCPDPSSTSSCLFYEMYVVSGFVETDLQDALSCFTRKPKDYAVGATIYGHNAMSTVPERVKENLIDGIYHRKTMPDCYNSASTNNPWFKLDLGSVKPIRRIMLLLQNNSNAVDFYNFEVRVGMVDVLPSAFPTYRFFGFFPGPSSPAKEIVFSHSDPIMAQYVSVQRWGNLPGCNPSTTCELIICHVEIN